MGIYQNLETLESNLYNAKKSLANALVGKGLDSNAENETLTQLIGKIDDIQTGGDSSGGYVQPKGLYIRVSNEENIVAQGWEGFVLTDTSSMFAACTSATSITFGESFDTSNVTDMSYMFNSCGKLISLDLSSFDTSNVTNMVGMFYFCQKLTSLDLSSFDTSNVTNMSYMFYAGNNLKTLDLSSFDTSNVTDMSYMFDACTATTSITFGESFDTSNVTNMSYMFNGCGKLKSLDLSSFDTSKVTDMSYMFGSNSWSSRWSLTSITFGDKWDTSNVTNMSNMFQLCENLTSLDLSPFNTSAVTKMSYMFSDCNRLKSIEFGDNFDTSNVTNMYYMFQNCSGLTSLDLSSFDTSKVTNMSYMFNGCKSLTSLDLSNFDTSNVTSMSNMFYNCSGLTEIHWDDFGNGSGCTAVSFSNSSKLGVNTTDYPNARQSLIDMLVTNSFDRASNGYSTFKITLHANTKAVLTEDEIAQITAKGFTIA